MDTDNLIEKPSVPEAKGPTGGALRRETASLVEMGSVLQETKGFIRGVELGFTPRSG